MMHTSLRSPWLRLLGSASLVALATCGDGTPTSPGPAPASVPATATQTAGAVTQSLLASGNGTANGKIYTTASIAPTPNALVLVAVVGHRSYGAPASPTVTGGGMTAWEEVATVAFDAAGDPLKRVTLFRAMSASPGTGPITITFPANVSNAQWIVTQWENVDVSGTNGSGAIAQTGSSQGDDANGLTLTLAPLGSGNVAVGVFGVSSSDPAITPGDGFTEIAEQPSVESPPSALQLEWATNDNTIDARWSGLNGGAIGIEIRAGNAGPPAPVATVTVEPANASVATGSTVQLTATPRDAAGNPLNGRAITWATSDPSIATVSATGLVTGNAEGSAMITAMSEGQSGTAAITVTPPTPGVTAVLVGAGDIGDCTRDGKEQTAALLDNIPGTVFTAGDNAYPDGTAEDYANCYDPNWGRHKARTRPSPGNHEYHTSGASAYFDYFGENAGPAGRGYYSYNLGEWHIVSLNSNVSMSSGSAQMTWLEADLAANPARCTLAYWHHPRFSSSQHGNDESTEPLYQALYDAGAEVVLTGHDHVYERFAPQTATGVADPVRGIRQFVVGTGGRSFYDFGSPEPNSEVRHTGTWGVIKLTLRPDGYDWQFVPVAGKTFTDEGSGTCHGPAEPAPNEAPVAQAGGPYRSEAVVAFDGAASRDPDGNTPLSYAWNFGDGTTGTGAAPSHTYASDGVYNVTLVVTDALGKSSAPVTTTATIANIAPTTNAGPNASVRLGEAFNVSATFSDPGANDAPWTYLIDWGDGSTSNGTAQTQDSPIAISHVYAAAGTYSVRVTVTDKDGGSGSDVLTATVTDASIPPPSPITQALMAAGQSTTNGKIYTTASITPAPNTLVVVAVMGHRSYGAPASPIVSGGGMTAWEEIATVTFDPVGDPLKRVTLFRAMSASPGSGPLTITFPSNVSNAQWIVTQWQNVDVSGTNGSGAIVRSGIARGDQASGLAVGLPAFENASNVAYGVFGVESSSAAVTPGSGFAEIGEVASPESPSSDLQAQWATNVNTIAATWAGLNGGSIGIEIRARAAAP